MSVNQYLSTALFAAAAGIAIGAQAADPNTQAINTNAPSANANVNLVISNGNNSVTTYAKSPFTTYDKNGNAKCLSSIIAQAMGETPKGTTFAQQYWTRVQCGDVESANAMINVANKADLLDTWIANKGNKAFAQCYTDSFPKGESSVITIGGVTVVNFGMHQLDGADVQKLTGAATYACKYELGLK